MRMRTVGWRKGAACGATGLALAGALLVAVATAPRSAAAQMPGPVFVDPGHGGDQPGVVAAGLEEKSLVLSWGFLVAEALTRAGYDVRMTRTGDAGPGFAERVARAEEEGASLFLSLHINGNEDPTVWGTEIYAAAELEPSMALARAVGEVVEGTGASVRILDRPWEVLRSRTVPTVMLELGHLTHPVERRLMVSRDYHREVAEALVRAVRQVLGPAPG